HPVDPDLVPLPAHVLGVEAAPGFGGEGELLQERGREQVPQPQRGKGFVIDHDGPSVEVTGALGPGNSGGGRSGSAATASPSRGRAGRTAATGAAAPCAT